jgi:hypothetical protein
MSVTSDQFPALPQDQTGKLTRFSNTPLRFFLFIWYKQFTESIGVAGWALFCNSRARPASKTLERWFHDLLNSSRPRDIDSEAVFQ